MSDAFDNFDLDNFLNDVVTSEFPELDESFDPDKAIVPDTANVELDGQIEVIFSSVPDVWSAGNDLLDKRGYVAELEAGIENAEDESKYLADEIQRLYAEYQKQASDMRKRQSEIQDQIAQARREIRAAQEHVRIAEGKFRQALINWRASKAFIENSLAYDQITAGLPWREFAFDYQIDGAKFMAAGGRVICADKMGLGKSLEALMTLDMLQVQRACVIVPDDIVTNFEREIKRWAPHRTIVMLGKQEKSMRDFIFSMLPNMEEFILLGNYSMWRKDKTILDQIVRARVEAVVLDEAHSIKKFSTSAAKGCRTLVLSANSCPECGKFVQRTKRDGSWYDDVAGYGPNAVFDARSFFDAHKEFYVCSGDVPGRDVAVERSALIRSGHCQWNELFDYVANITRQHGAMRSVKHVFPLTGTPILNSPLDLFPLLNLLDDELYPDARSFESMYCDRFYGKVVFKHGGMERIAKQLSGRYISRTKDDVGLELPPQEVITHTIPFDEERYPLQTKVIKQLSENAAIKFGDNVMSVLEMIALITRKRQANVWPAGITFKDENGDVIFSVGDEVQESMKLDAICSNLVDDEYSGLVPELTGMGDKINGERIVVFSQFKTALAELERRINAAGISVVRFDGDTPDAVRDQVKVDFDRRHVNEVQGGEYKWQVVLCNYKTGGQGLNFTHATQMVILDAEWNPGREDQAFARTQRLGQTENTTVHILEVESTIDDWMRGLIDDKADMIAGFEGEAKITASSLLDAIREGKIK